ncbi:hypothetical protein MTO96_008969 [Rhipicephalus appendiculatus]
MLASTSTRAPRTPARRSAPASTSATASTAATASRVSPAATARTSIPCLLKPSACLHGGVCESNSSHTFTCLCVDGYYGKTCHQYDPCFSSPCLHGARCLNESDVKFSCQCRPGYAGDLCEENINECLSSPCKNRGDCEDGINSFTCHCTPGYGGPLCEIRDTCPEEVQQTDKGTFQWQPVPHGSVAKVECPYGAYNPASEYKYARRKCRLLADGQTSWMKVSAQHCRYKSFQAAENITSELEYLTHDPRSIRPEQLRNFADKIEPIVDYAIKDIKIAQAMIHVISNFLALNDSVIEEGDANGVAVEKLVSVVERFTSEVVLGPGALIIENENLVVKAVAWSPKLLSQGQDFLSFSLRSNGDHYLHEDFSGDGDDQDGEENIVITIPFEALNDKFFRPHHYGPASLVSTGQVVLSAKIGDRKIENLTDPLIYSYPTYSAERYVCAFWDERRKQWSTVGVTTNQSGNVTVCTSSHMTAFSLLLDPQPGISLAPHHYRILSLISYVGCIMSIVGTVLHHFDLLPFQVPEQRPLGQDPSQPWIELCLGTAVATHYFLLACLAWMGVEAANMYQMLVHVFASSETCFMLKRVLIAWGIPAVIVGTCLAIDLEPYRSQDDYCVISSRNPFIYYIAFLGISCFILFVNLLVFIMVTRVLFKPRMSGATSKSANHNSTSSSGSGTSSPLPITAAQVRGAFTVMTLAGCYLDLRRLRRGRSQDRFPYPEARAAWSQLATTGTFKKNRGAGPQAASWCAYSNPKRNSHSSMVRVTSNSTDSTSTVVFNSNMWNKGSGSGGPAGARDCPTRLSRFSSVGSLLKNCNLQKADKNTSTLNRKEKASSKTTADELGAKPNHKEFYSSEDQVSSLVPDLYAGQEHQIKGHGVSAPDPMKYIDDDSRSTVTTLGLGTNQKAHILFAYTGPEATPYTRQRRSALTTGQAEARIVQHVPEVFARASQHAQDSRTAAILERRFCDDSGRGWTRGRNRTGPRRHSRLNENDGGDVVRDVRRNKHHGCLLKSLQ